MTFEEARAAAVAWARGWVTDREDDRLVLVWDPAARLRVALHGAGNGTEQADDRQRAIEELRTRLGTFFSGDVLAAGKPDSPDRRVFDVAWDGAAPLRDAASVRVLERRRSKDDWFEPVGPPWPRADDRAAIVTFASYKGGFGRSTALAATAAGLARDGSRVLAIDLDLEAPGLLTLMPPLTAAGSRPEGVTGLVDVLLDEEALEDAIYPYRDEPGLDVLAAGTVDETYLEKLSRLDYEGLVDPTRNDRGPLHRLLHRIEASDRYDVILLDARAGLHDLTAAALNGTPHLAVLFGRDTDESWAGLEQVVRQLGVERVLEGLPQQDLLLVHGKAPGAHAEDETYVEAARRFRERAFEVFLRAYYAEEAADGEQTSVGEPAADADRADDELILVPSASDDEAQHVPVGLRFDGSVLHGDGSRIPVDALGFGDLRRRILEKIGRDA